MLNLKRQTNIIFYKICLIGLFFLALFLLLNILLYNRLSLFFSSLGHKLEAICGCTSHFSFFNHPFIFSFLLLVGLGAAFFLGFTLIKALKLKLTTAKFIKTNLSVKKAVLSQELEKAVSFLNLEKRVVEIDSYNPIVFCFGFLKPKICVSSALVEKLNEQELMAVLLHEQYHLAAYENIRLFIVKTIAAVLFFVPGLNSLVKKYLTLSELSADEWSIGNFKDKTHLAGAIYKILKLKEGLTLKNSLAVASFNYITEERVERMVNDNYYLNIKIFKPKLLIKLFVLFCVISSFIFLVYSSQSVVASHGNNFCSGGKTDIDGQCLMILNESVCKMREKSALPKNEVCEELFYSVNK